MSSAERTPVVLLHGVGLDRTMWAGVEARMAASGRAVIALDLPGHGDEAPLREPQSLQSLAEDVLSRMPAGSVHLVGFSLGALIAQHIARFHPDRVASLSSVNSVCLRTPAEAERVEARLRTAGVDFAAGVEASIERWYPAGETTVPADIVAATRRTLLANDIESYVHAYTVFVRGDREIGPELSRIRVPALAITGELDPGSTPEMSQRLADAVPDSRIRVIANTRHMMPLEDTDAFVDAVTAFIEESEGQDS